MITAKPDCCFTFTTKTIIICLRFVVTDFIVWSVFKTVNWIRVVSKANTYTFYVNDKQVLLCLFGPGKAQSTWNGDQCMSNNSKTASEISDSALSSGKIGVGAFAEADAGIEIAFTNVV